MDVKGVLKFLKLESISEHFSGYIEDRIELLKLELQEDAAAAGAKVLLFAMMLIFVLCGLFFISMAIAIMLNNIMEHNFMGYFIVGGAYLIFTVIAFTLKDNSRIKNILYKTISKSFDKEK